VRRQPGRLTDVELKMLRSLSRGDSNTEIGKALGRTTNTVGTMLRVMYRILGARGRAHAVRRGFELGLLRPDGERSL
jgi:DNA-binding CsgD family transcriptional regulator